MAAHEKSRKITKEDDEGKNETNDQADGEKGNAKEQEKEEGDEDDEENEEDEEDEAEEQDPTSPVASLLRVPSSDHATLNSSPNRVVGRRRMVVSRRCRGVSRGVEGCRGVSRNQNQSALIKGHARLF